MTPTEAVEPEPLDGEVRDAEDTAERLSAMFQPLRDCQERATAEGQWTAIYRAYMGWKPAQSPYRINYVIREIFRQIETLKPQIARQFFGGDRLFKYLALNEDGVQFAEGATEVVNLQVRRYHILEELQQWLDMALLYGTAYTTYGWRTFRKVTRKITPLNLPTGGKPEWKRTSEERVWDAPYVDFLKPWEVYTHPHVENIQDAPAVFVVKLVSVDDLKTLVREGYLDADAVKKAMEEGDAGAGSATLQLYRGRLNATSYDGRLDEGPEGERPHLLTICWTNDGWEYALLNDLSLVRATRTEGQGIPLIALRNYPQPGEAWGLGEPLAILEDQKMLNDVTSMYADTIHFVLNPMWKVKNGAVQNWNTTTFKPGGKVVVTNMDDVEPLSVPPVNMDLQSVTGFLRNNMKLGTGLTDELGGTGSQQRTATGLARLQDAAGARMEHKTRLFLRPFEQVYEALYVLNQEHLKEEVATRLLGPDGKYAFRNFGPEVFQGPVDVEVELGNMAESDMEAAQRWQLAYRMVGQDPLVNREALLEKMFRSMGVKRPRMLLASSVTAEQDVLEEVERLYATGLMPDPKPSDNHKVHSQIHSMDMQTPRFQQLAMQAPFAAELAAKHNGVHQAYLQAQQQAMQQAEQTQTTPGGPGALVPEANQRAEERFDMSGMGAMSEGTVEGGMAA